jgi:hypothetical protein
MGEEAEPVVAALGGGTRWRRKEEHGEQEVAPVGDNVRRVTSYGMRDACCVLYDPYRSRRSEECRRGVEVLVWLVLVVSWGVWWALVAVVVVACQGPGKSVLQAC